MKHPDVFFRAVATPVVFALIALGIHFFLRGHNAPGGGFIAGLIVAAAALLGRMARDLRLLRIPSETLVPVGLLVALATGLAPMVVGKPFLYSYHGELTWPLIGHFEWSTAVLFDAGVFLVVVGTTITIIDLLAEESNLRALGASESTAHEDAAPAEQAHPDADETSPEAKAASGSGSEEDA